MTSLHEKRDRALSFGSDAEAYDRARPSYPSALIDDLMADEPSRVLDVGCGTGKLGRLLVERGCDVTGVEPDERMAELARRYGLTVDIGTLETWDAPGDEFDLVVAGQSWHWVEPTAGPAKVGAVLRSGGRFAAAWNLGRFDDDLQAEMDALYERIGPAQDSHPNAIGNAVSSWASTFDLSPLVDAEVRTYAWEQPYTRAEWLDQLPTHSNHRVMDPDALQALLDAVGALIDEHSGSVTSHYDTTVLHARRA